MSDRTFGSEAVAQGDGSTLGRELGIANLLRFLKSAGIRNTVWITADVHYTAAHYYDPGKAQFQDFDPFWEFASGPLHAGTFGPNALDNTFGPQLDGSNYRFCMVSGACFWKQGGRVERFGVGRLGLLMPASVMP